MDAMHGSDNPEPKKPFTGRYPNEGRSVSRIARDRKNEVEKPELALHRLNVARTALVESEEARLTDSLTGIPNRDGFTKRFQEWHDRSETKNHALIFLDLANFKDINDKFGHDAGDESLIIFAKALEASVRPNDIVARFGGDEFFAHLSFDDEDPDGTANSDEIDMRKHEDGKELDIGKRVHTFKKNLESNLARILKEMSAETDLPPNTEVAIKYLKKHPVDVGGLMFGSGSDSMTLRDKIIRADDEMYKVKEERQKNEKRRNSMLKRMGQIIRSILPSPHM